jgi:hypothetical protein
MWASTNQAVCFHFFFNVTSFSLRRNISCPFSVILNYFWFGLLPDSRNIMKPMKI